MSTNCVSIERIANGFEVSFSDPDIVAANSKSDKYQDPEVEMAFKTVEEVLAFLNKNLEKLTVSESYDSAFMKALQG